LAARLAVGDNARTCQLNEGLAQATGRAPRARIALDAFVTIPEAANDGAGRHHRQRQEESAGRHPQTTGACRRRRRLPEETSNGVVLRTAAQSIGRAQALARKYTAHMPQASVDAFLASRRTSCVRRGT
jgi:hypothetical protein